MLKLYAKENQIEYWFEDYISYVDIYRLHKYIKSSAKDKYILSKECWKGLKNDKYIPWNEHHKETYIITFLKSVDEKHSKQ